MFGQKAFKFSIGAKINECFASIYHDEVKDGIMRPTVSSTRSKEGLISRPTLRAIYGIVLQSKDKNLYMLQHENGVSEFKPFKVEISDESITLTSENHQKIINLENISYYKRKLKFCPNFITHKNDDFKKEKSFSAQCLNSFGL